jgi:hypothetical protein
LSFSACLPACLSACLPACLLSSFIPFLCLPFLHLTLISCLPFWYSCNSWLLCCLFLSFWLFAFLPSFFSSCVSSTLLTLSLSFPFFI